MPLRCKDLMEMMKITSNQIIMILFAGIVIIMINAFYFDCLLDFKDTQLPSLCTEIIPVWIGESIRETLGIEGSFMQKLNL